MNVKFYFGTQAKYDALAEKDSSALYFIQDTQRLYHGDMLIGTGAEATEANAGLLSPEDYAGLKRLIAAGTVASLTPIDGTISIVEDKIGVAISTQENNALIVAEDGLFVATPEDISEVYATKEEITQIEEELTAKLEENLVWNEMTELE